MSKINIRILAVLFGFIMISSQAKAWEFNAEIGLTTTTEYHDCQGYADGIVELCRLFLSSDDPLDKSFIKECVNGLRKNLKKCEKRNGKRKNNTTIKIGGSQQIK